MPSFLGGGISGCKVCGRAVSVMRGGFEDWRRGRKEEKGHLCARRQCVHREGFVALVIGWEAKRKIVCIEGPLVRRAVMISKM